MERTTVRRVAIAAACVLVVTVAGLIVVRSHKGASASGDRCSRHAAAADGRVTAELAGLRMRVPKGWYDVPVCFATAALDQPAGYITSQPPVAQCRPDQYGDLVCGPPVDKLGNDDVLLVASTVPRSATEQLRAMTTVAGLPAQIHFEKPGYDGERFVNLSVLVEPDLVLQLTAYAGPDARHREDQLWRMIRSAIPATGVTVPGQEDPDNRLTFTDPRGRRITVVPANLRCGPATYHRHHRRAVQLELQRNVGRSYNDILMVEALLVSRPTTYRLPVSAGSDEEGSKNAVLFFSRTDFSRHHPREVFGVSTDENAGDGPPRSGVMSVLEASCDPARLRLEIHGKLLSQSSDGPPMIVTGGVDLTGY